MIPLNKLMLKRFFYAALCCAGVFAAAACSSSAHIVIREAADYNLTVEFVPSSLLEKNITRLLTQKNTQTDEQSVFNRRELKDSLTQAGVTVTDIGFIGTMGLRVAGTIPYNHELLKDFINYDRNKQQTVLRISPENIAAFLKTLPQDSRDFIDLLMAPLFTGDSIGPSEYEELISAAYGKKIAAELRNASFVLTVDVPYAIHSTKITPPIGTVTLQKQPGNRAAIHIPLLELLCTTGTIEVQL